ncbi:M55 family metallopeptidase [Sphaerobacter thermophilus]|jgi:D-amino peptidase|uniref:Peptidase M55 D-aminopeptidase n=1 Tax=Sphaerobacter thermophilus (strain ATCC 49802 / DSM 20745 / KCCM 41009 / NCIMB 13125 / S 6022) TaxID=479434 RepID=D1C694_SPHTD|nr:M55 family metallopeptidase [Sphaerobacter thermophilus]ACZ37632.1 peptidase M55 D-aminopeptidase [Sphaerobacter thermophilus DSM 20745]PZN67055.1 MAG: peptide ABC transporter [Sphaerobacter thermophilus]
MRVLISADMEGTAGVAIWEQVTPPDLARRPAPAEYEWARTLMVNEVNAAIQGARAAGATEVIVNDSHDGMRNLRPGDLSPDAWLISGNRKPFGMMCGIDQGIDAVMFTGYHARAGTPNGVLAHTWTLWVRDVRFGDTPVGEYGLNAAVAGHFGVPVVMVAGDEMAVRQTQELLGDEVVGVIVKYGVGTTSARHMHPSRACQAIAEGAAEGLRRKDRIRPYTPNYPLPVTITLDNAEAVDLALLVPGTERVGDTSLQYIAEDGVDLIRRWQLIIAAASGAAR